MDDHVVLPPHRMKQKRAPAPAARSTTTARVRTTAAAATDAGDRDATTTAVRATRASAVPLLPADTAGTGALVGLPPAATTAATQAVIAPLPSVAGTTAAAGSLASSSPAVDTADTAASPSTTSKAPLSTGAKAGIAIGVVLGLGLIIGLGVFAFLKRRKARAGGSAADYSWSSKEKDVNFGTSPARANVKSDASFGNKGGIAAFGGFRRLSDASDHQDGMPLKPAGNTTQAGAFNQPPRASFMNGPSGPPPSIGSLYGAAAPAAAAGQQGPFGDPAHTGKTYIVRRTFEPSLADELIIYPGDHIQILVAYDDGWCLGVNLDSAKPGQPPQRGVFPKDCVEEMSDDAPLNNASNGLQRAPTLPPMNFEGTTPPAISVSSPESVNHRQKPSNNSLLDRFPEAPARNSTTSQKRTSSMIAGKDSDLFSQMAIR